MDQIDLLRRMLLTQLDREERSSGRKATRLRQPLMVVRITKKEKASPRRCSLKGLPVTELGTKHART